MTHKVVPAGADGRAHPTDVPSGTAVVMSDGHSRIHSGRDFIAGYTDVALGAGNSITLLVKVPAGKRCHMRPRLSPDNVARLLVYEGPTFSADGSAVPAFNRDRSSASTPGTTVFSGPTTSALGTLILSEVVSRAAHMSEEEREWLLAPATNYLVRMTNLHTAAQAMSLALDFYESNA